MYKSLSNSNLNVKQIIIGHTQKYVRIKTCPIIIDFTSIAIYKWR